ncbi:hypothetical protein CAPTEDRAFT_190052 [Capitella teleta]|uniref:Uncharacterized protein n=1 Tax=Capitella teleta TaxID=283909 RepID=R7VLI5_CAPTE|nr:hypothetical protein CAPTEDRAFT_190052 [Capitella teleta]|eukprot:ELU18301.1 hypothetical protein CAPTEDRAFT_190052 [Capitella teleta]
MAEAQLFLCRVCEESFKSASRLRLHEAACKNKRLKRCYELAQENKTKHLDHFECRIEKLESISRASACPWAQAVLQVALQFCEDIVTRPANFAPQSKDANTETVTDHQSVIIMYITGAVLHRLKKRYARSNRSDDLDVIKGLINHKKKKGPRPLLIAVKSRGGLLTPVEALEPLMRIAYQKSKTGLKSAGLFSAEVMATELPEESPISDLDDRVMDDIMRLFHEIMCHHECFLFLEKLKIKK